MTIIPKKGKLIGNERQITVIIIDPLLKILKHEEHVRTKKSAIRTLGYIGEIIKDEEHLEYKDQIVSEFKNALEVEEDPAIIDCINETVAKL